MGAAGAGTGWAARWDARVLAARDRLAERRPRLYRGVLAWQFGTYLVVDALLPRRRVASLAVLMVVATLVDSAATYLWVSERIAVEGNPLVDRLMAIVGDGPGLTIRAGLSATLVLALTWLATRHWEARAGMILAALALTGVTLLHAYGLSLLVR